MYKVRKKNSETNPAKAIIWVTSAAASPLVRKMEKGNSGSRRLTSMTANAASSTAAVASSPIVRALAQPCTGALTRA